MNYVIKRDGRKVDFNRKKIERAVEKAFYATDGYISKYAEKKATNIATYIMHQVEENSDTEYTIEQIQDMVETGLMSTKRKDVARNFVSYRNERTSIRMKNSDLMIEVGEKLTASNVQNQNANVDEHSFGGRMGEAIAVLTKQYALDYIISPKVRRNHINNRIYIHDLDNYACGCHNCLSIPFDDILRDGFNTRQTDVRPANSINTALQLIAVIFQLQSLQQFGGVSATHIDHTLVPYLRKTFMKRYILAWLKSRPEFILLDIESMIFNTVEEVVIDGDKKYTIERNEFELWVDTFKDKFFEETGLKEEDFYLDNENLDSSLRQSALYDSVLELKQAVEAMYHNLNTLQSRSGNQLPFTSINYGTCTSREGRLIIRALLEGSIKGVGKLHRTSIFPCGIWQCMKGVNRYPGDPNYDLYRLALKSTSKRLYPNYVNVDWSVNKGYDINDPRTYTSTMGCRTYNGYDINGFGQMKDGRGNIAPSTIIMPTLAMEAKEAVADKGTDIVEEFMIILDEAIADCRDGLIERFEYIASQPMEAAKFMYENGLMYGYDEKEGIRSALKHGTLAIGNIGLAETLQILIGCNHLDPNGMKVAKRIYELFNKRCKQFKEEYKLNFGVYNTPAENLAYTAMKKFRDRYGIIENVSENLFFTNSMHVPVWEEIDPFTKIDIESQLGSYSNAGCILYIELDSSVLNNIDAIESFVNYAMDHDVPYFAINIPNDTCLDCGYTGEFDCKCPVCGSDFIQQLRRVTGYVTGDFMTAFNLGKQQETKMRFQHTKKLKVKQKC